MIDSTILSIQAMDCIALIFIFQLYNLFLKPSASIQFSQTCTKKQQKNLNLLP